MAACAADQTDVDGEGSAPTTVATTAAEGAEVPSVPPSIPGSFVIGALQEGLYLVGHDPGPIDGLFGEATAAAVRSFQEEVGIPVSGHLDEATALALADASPAAQVLAVEALHLS